MADGSTPTLAQLQTVPAWIADIRAFARGAPGQITLADGTRIDNLALLAEKWAVGDGVTYYATRAQLDARLLQTPTLADDSAAVVLGDPAHDPGVNDVDGRYIIKNGARTGPFDDPAAAEARRLYGLITSGAAADADTLAKVLAKAQEAAGNARTGAVSDIRDDVDADSDTLAKLRAKAGADAAAARTGAVSDIRDDVDADSDTLAKLRAKAATDAAAARTGAVSDIRASVNADSDTLAKLRAKAETDAGNARTGAVSDIRGGVSADSDTLGKLRQKVVADTAAARTGAVSDVRGGVATDSDTLAKLRTRSDQAAITARDDAIDEVRGGVSADSDTLGKLRQKIVADTAAARTGAVSDVRGGVSTSRDTLAKLDASIAQDRATELLNYPRLAGGKVDAANLPDALFAAPIVIGGLIADLSAAQQAQIIGGSAVLDNTGQLWAYKSGSKTQETSYQPMADRTPDFTQVSGKPTTRDGYGITDVPLKTQSDQKAVDEGQRGRSEAVSDIRDGVDADSDTLAKLRAKAATDAAAARTGAVSDIRDDVDADSDTLAKLRTKAATDAAAARTGAVSDIRDDVDADSDTLAKLRAKAETDAAAARTGAVSDAFEALGAREVAMPLANLAPVADMDGAGGVYSLDGEKLRRVTPLSDTALPAPDLDGGSLLSFNGIADATLRPDGSFAQTIFDNGAAFNAANLSHAVPALHFVKNQPQLAVQMPWRDGDDRAAVFPLIWSGRGPGAPQVIEKVTDDVYAFQCLEGTPSTVCIPKGKARSSVSVNAIIGYCETGQSLATGRVGSSPTNAWNSPVEWGANISEQLLSFDTISGPGNSTTGTDQASENIAIQEFQLAVDAQVGNAAANGNILRTSSSMVTAGLVLAHAPTGPCDGRKVFLAELGNGGKPIEHFRKDFAGTDAGHFAGVYVPTLERFKNRADNASYSVLAWVQPWIQGENDHVEDDTRAVYRTELDGYLDDDCETEIDRVLGAGVTRLFIGYQMGRIYESNTPPYPAGSSAFEISQITLAIVDKGLSDAASDANFILSPPTYGLTFTEISHMDARGYMHLKAMMAHTANAGLAAKALGLKWKPLHFDPAKVYLTNGGKRLVMPAEIPMGACSGLRLGAREGVDRFTGVPQKTNHGLYFRGGSAPNVGDIYLNDARTAVIVDFETAWTGTGREIGVAFKAEVTNDFTGYRQGWTPIDSTPTGERVHNGVGSNISVDMGWIEPSTGAAIPAYASHQLIAIPD